MQRSFCLIGFGRARWGASGALYPQSAIAGSNSRSEARRCGVCPWQVVSKAGSLAMGTCEPRQVRKEATVSGLSRVPRST